MKEEERKVSNTHDLHDTTQPSNIKRSSAAADQGLTVDNTQDKYGKTALHKTSRSKCHISVDALLEKGADVDKQDFTGLTALHEACMVGSRQVVETLLTWGANVNIEDNMGQTPAHMASTYGHVSVLKLLLEAGANVNAQSFEGLTPLHMACYGNFNGKLKILNLLIENKANVNMANTFGETALHTAAMRFHYKIAERLLEKGAQIGVVNQNNESPYDKTLIICSIIEDIRGVKTKACLEIHILKLKMAGLPVSINVYTHIDGYADIKTKCLEELEKMRNTKILGNFSLKHLISEFENPWFLRNPVIFEKLEESVYSPEFLEAFPLYAHILINTFEKSKQRFELLVGASQSFSGGFENLPELMKMKILDYLSNDDLQNFINV